MLKPIDLGELKKAIKRYKLTIKSTPQSENLKLTLDNMKTADLMEHKLVLQTQEGELRLVLKNIVPVEGERNYSYIYLNNYKRKLVSKALSDMEDLLHEKGFSDAINLFW